VRRPHLYFTVAQPQAERTWGIATRIHHRKALKSDWGCPSNPVAISEQMDKIRHQPGGVLYDLLLY